MDYLRPYLPFFEDFEEYCFASSNVSTLTTTLVLLIVAVLY
jgi:hypothetical protein